MWCHLLLLLPLVGVGLLWVLPWPAALATTGVLTAIGVGIAVPAVCALRRPIMTGREGLVGSMAEAANEIAREGTVRHGGEFWTVTSDIRIPKGARVRITGVRGLKLVVRPVGSEVPTHGGRKGDE